jgi:hypothetical protein
MPSRALMQHALVLRAVGLGLSMASAAPGGIEMARQALTVELGRRGSI